MVTRSQAKVTLKKRGWSYRAVAPVLGVTPYHLCQVLNGRRESRRLLQAISVLPARQTTSDN
jgi:hypothetical protein